LGLSLSAEARCGRIFLKFLHNNLALIYIHSANWKIFPTNGGFAGTLRRKNGAVF
jgi:hypothetical protein